MADSFCRAKEDGAFRLHSYSAQEGQWQAHIIALFNNNRLYGLMFVNVIVIFITVNHICTCFGIPEPHLRQFRLAAIDCFVLKRKQSKPFLKDVSFSNYVLKHRRFAGNV